MSSMPEHARFSPKWFFTLWLSGHLACMFNSNIYASLNEPFIKAFWATLGALCRVLYGSGNEPRTANDPHIGPQMIPILDCKRSPNWTANDPQIGPQMIPKLDRKWSQNWTANDPHIGPKKIPILDRKWSSNCILPNWTAKDPHIGPQMIPILDSKWSQPKIGMAWIYVGGRWKHI